MFSDFRRHRRTTAGRDLALIIGLDGSPPMFDIEQAIHQY
jgi:hypothetical protein